LQDLNAMAIFAHVVESGGFSAAARELGISKSAVSKQVSQLEHRLNARLLNRTTRSLSLTEIGREFHERCLRIVAEAEEAELAVNNLQDAPRGTLRINLPMNFALQHITPYLPDFMKRYPELKIDMDLDDRVIDLIEEGYDMAIRIARLPDSSHIARKLAPFCVSVCATPEYWDTHGRPTHPKDLAKHNCLQYKYLAGGNEWYFRSPKENFSVKIKGSVKANNGSALHMIVAGGLGVGMIPTFEVGENLKSGKLEAVLEEWMIRDLAIYAIYPQTRHLSTKVRVFIDFLIEHFGAKPYWDHYQD